jgi:hypothetical protein
MSRLQELHPDQEAVLQLVLRRRMAYADLAGALGLSAEQVRERALDAVDGLAPDDIPGLELGDRDRIADLLLGQGPEQERDTTRELLRTHAAAHGWASAVAAELEPLGGPREPVPPAAQDVVGPPDVAEEAPGTAVAGAEVPATEAPGTTAPGGSEGSDGPASDGRPSDPRLSDGPGSDAAEHAAPEPGVTAAGGDVRGAFAALDASRPGSDDAHGSRGANGPRRSRGLLGLAVVALVAAALVVAWVGGVFDGGDGAESVAAPVASTTTSGAAQDAADAKAFLSALPKQINFYPPSGAQGAYAKVRGVAQSMLSQTTGAPVLALVTENMPKATSRRRYFAWADKLGEDPILLGQLTDARGAELPFTGADVSTGQAVTVDPTVYNRVRITRSGPGTSAPRKPGPTVIVGTLTLRSAG